VIGFTGAVAGDVSLLEAARPAACKFALFGANPRCFSPRLQPRGLQQTNAIRDFETPIGLFVSGLAFSGGLEKHWCFTLDHLVFAVG
jgi:hypothetical protein